MHSITVIYQSHSLPVHPPAGSLPTCLSVIWTSISLSINHGAISPRRAGTRHATPSPRSFIKSSLTPAKGTHWHREPLRRLTTLLIPFPCSCSQGPEDHDDPDESPRRRHCADLGAGLPGQHPHSPPSPRGDAVPTDSLASLPALYGVGLVALGCITVPTLVHPWTFRLYPVLAPGARQGLLTPYAHLTAPPSPCRTKSSPSPSSPGRGWGAGSSMAARSTTARSWCWSGCRLSSTAPCTAAPPRTPWAPPTLTPGSSFSVRRHRGGHPSLHKSLLISSPTKTISAISFPLENPNIPRGTEDSNGEWWWHQYFNPKPPREGRTVQRTSLLALPQALNRQSLHRPKPLPLAAGMSLHQKGPCGCSPQHP